MYISCQIRGPFEGEQKGRRGAIHQGMDPYPKVSTDFFPGQNSSQKVKVGAVLKLNLNECHHSCNFFSIFSKDLPSFNTGQRLILFVLMFLTGIIHSAEKFVNVQMVNLVCNIVIFATKCSISFQKPIQNVSIGILEN